MTKDRLQKIENGWRTFVAGYEQGGVLEPLQQLKREHSIRVSAETRMLAADMDWPAESVHLAAAVGLLHDTGRFPQYERFRSFNDKETIDHGDCGADALERAGFLDSLDPAERDLVLHAVRYHNKKHLPQELTDREEQYLRLIRDADRLDIFFVACHAIQSGQVHKHPELMIGIDFEGPPTLQVIEQLERRETIDYAHLKSMADRFMLFLGWIYDFSFAASRRKVHERRVIDRFIEFAPVKTDRMLHLFDEAAAFCAGA